MTFTKNERYIISNQLRILARLDKENAADYARDLEVLENGFDLESEELMAHLSEPMDSNLQNEVHDTLGLFQTLNSSFKKLPAGHSVKESDVMFRGWDGNAPIETTMIGYARFLVVTEKKYTGVLSDRYEKANFNAHAPRRERYRRMVGAWKTLGTSRYDLTEQQIQGILTA